MSMSSLKIRGGEVFLVALPIRRPHHWAGHTTRIGEGYTVLLDSHGREWTSQEFGEWLGQRALHGTRELVFVVGGPEGFSSAFREEADLLLSLSRLTLTHDWARTLLLEQIYRGFTMLRGYPYPR